MSKQSFPTFYLYGEPHRLVAEGFVHVETLDDRSRPSEWTIKPHAHSELSHIFLITSGGGAMEADGAELRFVAPSFLLVPATAVHGFKWLEETAGFVITMADAYLQDLGRHGPELTGLFERPDAIEMSAAQLPPVERLVADLMRELSWSAPGHRAAVDAAMLSLLVTALRHRSAAVHAAPRAGPHASIVARLRERIEQRFRLREPVSVHAAALGVSQTALRVACARMAGRSPAQMLDQRALLEAQRALLYSNLSIAEIGFSIGFADPAYFSRFFQRNMGLSARSYREAQQGANG
ncbi:helix-turn-helix domain-containing protein [Sphingobium yanoikuyae]|jgi:AraC family transcriptional activator of pobA|uniref:helix-turn-helix domain-containing protein n=1 Tax=Sphingobium yanoikuyae TaxID=13690 RepID=UPI0004E3D90F|nr:helix-turn-helix domain-containing protein [Sphingobium yanoikuyae]KFD25842.1 AraC family transcriptional regulator [Sphingobium yanoikuyae]KZC81542.1 AraC family transcriptional regulator [Sphingobium yanoikuyae]MDV3478645.1 helix-turn-helix domain-containing protein [Sphingobium yanoikuyae]